jgi:hypothetical protein
MSSAGKTIVRTGNAWIWRSAPVKPVAYGLGFRFWGFYFSPAGGD